VVILECDMLVISSMRKIFIFSFPTKNLTFNLIYTKKENYQKYSKKKKREKRKKTRM